MRAFAASLACGVHHRTPSWAKHGLTKSIRTFSHHEANLFEHDQLTQHRRLGLTQRTHEFRNAYPTTVRFREQIQ
jgi:hypothetical protein